MACHADFISPVVLSSYQIVVSVAHTFKEDAGRRVGWGDLVALVYCRKGMT